MDSPCVEGKSAQDDIVILPPASRTNKTTVEEEKLEVGILSVWYPNGMLLLIAQFADPLSGVPIIWKTVLSTCERDMDATAACEQKFGPNDERCENEITCMVSFSSWPTNFLAERARPWHSVEQLRGIRPWSWAPTPWGGGSQTCGDLEAAQLTVCKTVKYIHSFVGACLKWIAQIEYLVKHLNVDCSHQLPCWLSGKGLSPITSSRTAPFLIAL